MPLSLPKLNQFGCSAKARASTVLRLAGSTTTAYLSADAGELSIDANMLGTIDAIFTPTQNPSLFGEIGAYHVLNDLWAAGGRPGDVLVSYEFDETAIQSGDAQLISEGLARGLGRYAISATNLHTMQGDRVTITAAAIGRRIQPRHAPDPSMDYSLVLTKPLGGAAASFAGYFTNDLALAKRGEATMVLAHGELMEAIGASCWRGTTDISGFGLLGHLASVATATRSSIEIACERVPVLAGLSVLDGFGRCAADRNRVDFAEECSVSRVSAERERRLYDAETSGPIVCVVTSKDASDVLSKCIKMGFSKAAVIGSLRVSDQPGVTVQ